MRTLNLALGNIPYRLVTLLVCWIIIFVSTATAQQPDLSVIDFARDIQPILSENCYYCHGPDPNQRQAGLRLDVEEDALATIEVGEPEDSELFIRIMGEDDVYAKDYDKDTPYQMPPPLSNRKLSDEQKELIRQWIVQGAKWGKHWAYTQVKKTTPEAENAIDYFIARKLEENKLDFSAEADKASLVRRVSIDVTGLPPTVKQLDEFLADESSDAYEKMVDRFLASPAYGERMAWRWLDAARYADSNGYQGDNERTMWPWRDWVVKAYNENMPFDQFSIWQLAGDLLPNATDEQILATAFNRNHPINGEGGRIAEENRVDYVMDMSETAGTVWLALTFNCCRCHDHKYDQLTQEDYYSLNAFFNQTPITGGGGNPQTPPTLPVPSADQTRQVAKCKAEVETVKEELNLRSETIADDQLLWERQQLNRADRKNKWQIMKPSKAFADQATLKKQKDGSVLATVRVWPKDAYRISGRSPVKKVRALRIEAMTDETMRDGKLSRSSNGNFILTGISAFVLAADKAPQPIEIASAFASSAADGFEVAMAFDDNDQTGWSVAEKDLKQMQEAVFVFAEPVELPEGGKMKVVFEHQAELEQQALGRFRILLSPEPETSLLGMNYDLWKALETDVAKRSDTQKAIVEQAFFMDDAEYASIADRLKESQEKQRAAERAVPKVMVMADREKPRKTYLLNRGSYQEPKSEVSASVPAMLGPLPEGVKADRLALANWLFSDKQPLTPRVSANRLWEQIFGIGLVKTTEDFGVQGEPPSHPELLDWLAGEYRDSGWDTKHVFRQILNSRTYKQSSKVTPELLELDPKNRLLARAPRYRMPSWMIRDYALAVSGRLVSKLGGKPVYTYQPGGVWEEASFGKKKYKQSKDPAIYRRSLYTFWRRIAAPTMFFDNADRMTCSVKTFRTNTPLHALNTLNDTTFVEASRLLATKAIHCCQSDEDRLQYIFKTMLLRTAQPDEQEILINAIERSKRDFSDDPKAAQQFIEVGDVPADTEIDPVDLASWTSLCLAVLNLDETLTRQ